VIPTAALLSGSEGNYVYLVKPGEPPADLQPANAGAQEGSPRQRGAKAGDGPAQKQPPFYVVAQPVKVDLTEGSQVILSGGVKAGDPIVVDGQEKLRSGSRVIPKEATNPNGPRAVNPNRADTGVGSESQSGNRPQGGQPRTGGQQP
jgi:multidrug efflux system membrane fusion protein